MLAHLTGARHAQDTPLKRLSIDGLGMAIQSCLFEPGFECLIGLSFILQLCIIAIIVEKSQHLNLTLTGTGRKRNLEGRIVRERKKIISESKAALHVTAAMENIDAVKIVLKRETRTNIRMEMGRKLRR